MRKVFSSHELKAFLKTGRVLLFDLVKLSDGITVEDTV